MSILEVSSLSKQYPTFSLKDVSFSLEKGRITGFIGRNGAGKTTTLKALLNFVHPNSGTIRFFNKSFSDSELEIKQRIGFVSGGINYYPKKKIKLITEVTKSFYSQWDNAAYNEYMHMFNLDENKTPSALSEGMKVKYALALALSHNAELLILDEPTSGLDPVSREDLLDVFLELSDRGITILFSTHITSDLDKCADDIIYIKNGEILAQSKLDTFCSGYNSLSLTKEQLREMDKERLIGCKRSKHGYTAIIKTTDAKSIPVKASPADLETIMVHMEKEETA